MSAPLLMICASLLFATMGVSSFSSGVLVSAAGWEKMNIGALPVLAIVAIAVAWLAWRRAHHRVRVATS